MALITRCPHCTTTFRVTPLHLQAHSGDVRCGRCAQVFNAFSTLSTIQEPGTGDLVKGKAEEAPEDTRRDRPAYESPALAVSDHVEPPSAPSQEVTQTEAPADTVTPEAVIPETAVPEAIIPEEPISDTVMLEAGGAGGATADVPPQAQSATEPEPAERLTEGPDRAAVRFSDGSATDTASASGKNHTPGISEPETPANATHAARAHAQQVHVKEPEQEAGQRETQETHEQGRSKQETRETHEHEAQAENYAFDEVQPPQASVAWTFASLLLLTLFTGQTIYFYRAELASLVPAAKPYLEQYCKLLQCTVSLPRHPQLLNIESSDMNADPQHPGVITLSATIRNHASYPQPFPLFELTFINNQNKPLASRIFKPDVYLGEEVNVAGNVSPGNEFNVRLHLDTDDLNAAGYRLSLLSPSS